MKIVGKTTETDLNNLYKDILTLTHLYHNYEISLMVKMDALMHKIKKFLNDKTQRVFEFDKQDVLYIKELINRFQNSGISDIKYQDVLNRINTSIMNILLNENYLIYRSTKTTHIDKI